MKFQNVSILWPKQTATTTTTTKSWYASAFDFKWIGLEGIRAYIRSAAQIQPYAPNPQNGNNNFWVFSFNLNGIAINGKWAWNYCVGIKTFELCIQCMHTSGVTDAQRSIRRSNEAHTGKRNRFVQLEHYFKSSSNQYFRCTIETSTLTYVGSSLCV